MTSHLISGLQLSERSDYIWLRYVYGENMRIEKAYKVLFLQKVSSVMGYSNLILSLLIMKEGRTV